MGFFAAPDGKGGPRCFLPFPSPPSCYRSIFCLLKLKHKGDLCPRSRAQEMWGVWGGRLEDFVFGCKTSKSPFIINSPVPL